MEKFYNDTNNPLRNQISYLIDAINKIEIAIYQTRTKLLEIQSIINLIALNYNKTKVDDKSYDLYDKPYVESWFQDNILHILIYDLPPHIKKIAGAYEYENAWQKNISKAILSLPDKPSFKQKCFCWIEFYCPANSCFRFDIDNHFVGVIIDALHKSYVIDDDNYEQLGIGVIGFSTNSSIYKTYAKISTIDNIYNIISTQPSNEIASKKHPIDNFNLGFW